MFSSHSFWTSSSLDIPAGVTQEEGHTGILIHLLPFCGASKLSIDTVLYSFLVLSMGDQGSVCVCMIFIERATRPCPASHSMLFALIPRVRACAFRKGGCKSNHTILVQTPPVLYLPYNYVILP